MTQPGDGDGEGIEGLLADLSRWTAESQALEAAGRRAKEAWLLRQAQEEATWAAMLVDLAERSAAVVLHTCLGRTHQGRLVACGDDFLVLVPTARGPALDRAVFVASAAVAALRPRTVGRQARSPGAVREQPQPASHAATLVQVLTAMAEDRPRVMVRAGPGPGLVGELRSVGMDVATLRLDGEPASVYLRLPSLIEVSVLGSG